MQLNVRPTASQGVLQASKWLSYPMLVDVDEMESLFQELGEFKIFLVSGVSKRGEGSLSKEAFIQVYSDYVNALKEGSLLPDSHYRTAFSSVFTTSADALFAVHVGDNQQLIKITRPVIQLQVHRVGYSTVDGKFRSMVFGPESISWGIQFSYPQICQDPQTKIVEQVSETPAFPNTALFRRLQRWGRHHTIPTPFLVGDKRINVPVRLGKHCLPWINNHLQLIQQGIAVISK